MDSQYVHRKVRTNIKEALADSVLLLKTSSRGYIPFVELGETSEYYHHDMYHLLASRSIEALQRVEELGNRITNDGTVNPVKQDIIAIYGNMISAYKATGLKEGYVLTALNYLEWRWNADRNIRPLQAKGELPVLTEDTYLKALNRLKTSMLPNPSVPKSIWQKPDILLENNSSSMHCSFAMRQSAFIQAIAESML